MQTIKIYESTDAAFAAVDKKQVKRGDYLWIKTDKTSISKHRLVWDKLEKCFAFMTF